MREKREASAAARRVMVAELHGLCASTLGALAAEEIFCAQPKMKLIKRASPVHRGGAIKANQARRRRGEVRAWRGANHRHEYGGGTIKVSAGVNKLK